MRHLRVPKVYASQAVYLDPGDCDSLIGFNITSRTRMHAVVELADCDRKVKWYFSDIKQSIEKIDRAIQALQQFKVAFIAARKQYHKRGRK